MALAALSGDEQLVIFVQLCNVLDPGVAVAFGSASNELWTLTQAPRQQLQADHESAAALGGKAGYRTCMELREAKEVQWSWKGLSSDDLALLGTLGSVLPALEELRLNERAAGPEGVPRLAEKLGAGALPAVIRLNLNDSHVGDAGASALAAALGRGALPRLRNLNLYETAIGDGGLVALAPALRRLPALEELYLARNPLGDEGLAALVAPPPPSAGAPTTTTGVLTKLKLLHLGRTQIAEAGCAALASALESGALPALEYLYLEHNPIGDEGLAALVAPPQQPAGAPPPTTGGLTKLKELSLNCTRITDAGCGTLAAALDSGALPALKMLSLYGTASATAIGAVYAALRSRRKDEEPLTESEEGEEESGSEAEEDDEAEDAEGDGEGS